jgi:hypothetical protein
VIPSPPALTSAAASPSSERRDTGSNRPRAAVAGRTARNGPHSAVLVRAGLALAMAASLGKRSADPALSGGRPGLRVLALAARR